MAELYEYFYRGPTFDNGMRASYHVVLSEDVEAFGKKQTITRGPLTPTQAAAEGFTLDVVQGAMAAQLSETLDVEREDHRKTKSDLEALRDEKIASDKTIAEMANRLSDAKAIIEKMLVDMTTLDEAVRTANLRAETAEVRLHQEAALKAQSASVDAEAKPGIVSRVLSFVGLGNS